MFFQSLAAAAALMAVCLSPQMTSAMDDDKMSVRARDLKIERAWTRATPKSARAGGGYLTITNAGDTDDRLLAASSERAGETQIHEMSVTDGVMKMRQLADGLAIPAGETVELKPGGFHVMFMGLTAPIAEGDIVSVTLTFENAGEVAVDMTAAALGAKEPPMDHSGHQ